MADASAKELRNAVRKSTNTSKRKPYVTRLLPDPDKSDPDTVNQFFAAIFFRRNVLKCSIPATPPWVFKRSHMMLTIVFISLSPHQKSIEISSSSSVIITRFFSIIHRWL